MTIDIAIFVFDHLFNSSHIVLTIFYLSYFSRTITCPIDNILISDVSLIISNTHYAYLVIYWSHINFVYIVDDEYWFTEYSWFRLTVIIIDKLIPYNFSAPNVSEYLTNSISDIAPTTLSLLYYSYLYQCTIIRAIIIMEIHIMHRIRAKPLKKPLNIYVG